MRSLHSARGGSCPWPQSQKSSLSSFLCSLPSWMFKGLKIGERNYIRPRHPPHSNELLTASASVTKRAISQETAPYLSQPEGGCCYFFFALYVVSTLEPMNWSICFTSLAWGPVGASSRYLFSASAVPSGASYFPLLSIFPWATIRDPLMK